jgi:hypothetical protein
MLKIECALSSSGCAMKLSHMFHVALCAQFFCLTMPAHSVVDISVRKGKSAMIPVCIGGLDAPFSEIVGDHLNLSGFFRMLPEVDATASDGAFPGTQLRNWKHVPVLSLCKLR